MNKKIYNKLKEKYSDVLYIGNGLYVCNVLNMWYDLYHNDNFLNTYVVFEDMQDAISLIKQQKEKQC